MHLQHLFCPSQESSASFKRVSVRRMFWFVTSTAVPQNTVFFEIFFPTSIVFFPTSFAFCVLCSVFLVAGVSDLLGSLIMGRFH